MKQRAEELYGEGYACAESIVKAAAEKGHIPAEFVKLSSGYARGMSSGCLCGALAGAQLVIGAQFGRSSSDEDLAQCAIRSKQLIDEFKGKYKLTCCRGLGGKLPPDAPERKELCARIVGDVAEILGGILDRKQPGA
jgi:C_GCAxxG_C_C family probable redox protein